MLRLQSELYRHNRSIGSGINSYVTNYPIVYDGNFSQVVITKYRDNIRYIPIKSVYQFPEKYQETRYRSDINRVSGLLRKKISKTSRYIDRNLQTMNDLLWYMYPGGLTELTGPEQLDEILAGLKEMITGETETLSSRVVAHTYTTNSLTRIHRFFSGNDFYKIGNVVTGDYSIQRIVPTIEPINDAFGIAELIQRNQMFYKGIPLLYFAIDRKYVTEYKMRSFLDKTDDVDVTRFKLLVDPMVVAKGTPYITTRKYFNTVLLPIAEKLKMEVIFVDMEKEIIDNREYGYGVDRFKKPLEKYKTPIREFLQENCISSPVGTYFDIN